MKIAVTGHANIEKIVGVQLKCEYGYCYDNKAFHAVYNAISRWLNQYCRDRSISLEDITLISGMARGVDEVFAIFAIRNNMKLILSVPGSVKWHKNRSLSRGMRAQAIYYDKILKYKNIIDVVEVHKDYGEGFYLVNMARNQHMVDMCDVMVSLKAYDSTGTDDGIKRALAAGKYAGNISVYRHAKRFYSGDIKSLEKNQIFVFGSNPEGRHGTGAANIALKKFGAVYGNGRGLQGNSYALPTKNLTEGYLEETTGIVYSTHGKKSLSVEQIRDNIHDLYQCANENPELEFFIAYKADGNNLNGYSGLEMFEMFTVDMDVPDNIIFHETFKELTTNNAVYTSYLAKMKDLPSNMKKVSIMRWTPKWAEKYIDAIDTNIAPDEETLRLYKQGKINENEYKERFQKVLDAIDPIEFKNKYSACVLLCSCKDGLFCHRHLIAEHMKKYDIDVKELKG